LRVPRQPLLVQLQEDQRFELPQLRKHRRRMRRQCESRALDCTGKSSLSSFLSSSAESRVLNSSSSDLHQTVRSTQISAVDGGRSERESCQGTVRRTGT
jgi:hypothetical protein